MRAFINTSARKRPGARVGATYSILKSSVDAEQLEDERERLTLQPRASFGKPPPAFPVWSEDDTMFHVPRFYGIDRFGDAEFDDRVKGVPVEHMHFTGTLTPVQIRAMDAIQKHMGASGVKGSIVSLPCGMGKTVFAVAFAARMKRKTAIIVHKGQIGDQWVETFQRFSPGLKIGWIQGKDWQMEGMDVVVCMVMTLAKRELDPKLFDEFGVVIADEAHHYAAPVMQKAMKCFNAEIILGLTATKFRPDGLTPLLNWSLGPDGFHVERDASESVRVSIALYGGATREILTKAGQPLVAVMINQLAVHVKRNQFIAKRIVAFRAQGRVILILSDRISQLTILQNMVHSMGIPAAEIGVFRGGQKDEERREQLSRPVVLCTYGMANEGLDKKEADTCIMATPKGRVTQCIGRIQRPCADKQSPLVLDIADDVGIFTSLRWGRQRMYNKNKYTVQVHNADVDESEWYT